MQNVKDFEELINAYREEENYLNFIAGSNSNLIIKSYILNSYIKCYLLILNSLCIKIELELY